MDRHNLSCPAGTVMRQFQLVKNGEKMIYFKYSCCQLKFSTVSCNTIDTGLTVSYTDSEAKKKSSAPESNFKTFFSLDQQKINIPSGRAIAQFKLNSVEEGK